MARTSRHHKKARPYHDRKFIKERHPTRVESPTVRCALALERAKRKAATAALDPA